MICDITENDMEQILETGKEFWKETYYSQVVKYDEERARDTLLACIHSDSGIAIWHPESASFFMGYVTDHWFADMKYAFDFCIWVPKSHRGRGTGYRLLKSYIDRAKLLGAKEIFLGDIADIDASTLYRIHEKLGLSYRNKAYSLLVGE